MRGIDDISTINARKSLPRATRGIITTQCVYVCAYIYHSRSSFIDAKTRIAINQWISKYNRDYDIYSKTKFVFLMLIIVTRLDNFYTLCLYKLGHIVKRGGEKKKYQIKIKLEQRIFIVVDAHKGAPLVTKRGAAVSINGSRLWDVIYIYGCAQKGPYATLY